MNNGTTADAVAGQPASRRGFRGCVGFAVHAVACFALLFVGPLPSAQAQTTRTWDNSVTTGLWSGTGSWLGNVVPTSTTDIAAFSSTNTGLVLTATGAATPSIGQLYFDNAGTTTLQLNRITLNSGTGIVVTANSGNVFISNTSVGTTTNSPVIIATNQIWLNNSTSGTLSVQTAGGGIFLSRALTIDGSGATQLQVISGSGNLTKQGAGTLTFTGANSSTGTTTVSAGTLRIGTGSTAGSLTGNLVNNAAVVFDRSDALTYAGILSGNGTLTKQGAGTLTLTGANTFTGITTVSSGTLAFGRNVTGSDFGQFAGDIVNNATVRFGVNNQPVSGTYSGVISGAGAVTKDGLGTLTLTGANTFTGNTTISQGTLQIGDGGGTGSIGSSNIAMGNQAVLIFNRSGDLTYGGTISVPFGQNTFRKLGSGKLTLTGSVAAFQYFFVDQGTLEFGNGGTTGFLPNNDVTNNATLAFNRSDSVTYTGRISGTGNFTKLGSGTLTLTPNTSGGGLNSFSGITTVSEGVITIGNASALPNSGIDTAGSGIITASSSQTSLTIGGLIGSKDFSSVFTTNLTGITSLTLQPQAGRSFSYSGVIANRGSNLAITKTGPGEQILTGLSTFSGAVTISQGTLTVDKILNSGSDSPLGRSGTINFNSANAGILRYTGAGETTNRVFNLSNGANVTGGIENNGSGALVISSTITGASGTLARLFRLLGTNSGTNQIVSISGTNVSVEKSGPGTWWLTGASTYTGTTTVLGGTLQIGNGGTGGSIVSNIVNSANVVFNRSDNLEYAGIISGGGSLTKQGAGRLTLTGQSTFNGVTNVSAGILEISNGGVINSTSGVTVNGAGAEFKYNSSTSFNRPLTLTQGILSGTGTINTAVSVAANAIISPGNSPGSQTYTSSEWLQNGTYRWELNAMTGVAGTNWDQVTITNLLNLTGLSASNKFNLNLTTLNGSNTAGPLDVGYVSGQSYIFPFVTFGSLSVPAPFSNTANSDLTSLFNISLVNWQGTKPSAQDISVKVNSGGTGLDLVIVPEPATIALAAIGIGTAVWFLRRRRVTA